MTAPPAASLQGVHFAYGRSTALRDVSFDLPRGSFVGLLGRNGAGKTTTMALLAGLLAPSSGSVRVLGHGHHENPDDLARRLGYLPERPPLYPAMEVGDFLLFCARLKGLSEPAARARVADLAGPYGLDEVLATPCGRLSHGYRQRAGLAAAMAGDPELLLLDEPTAGLDPAQAQATRTILKAETGRRTVLLCSHHLGEVERLCDRLVILHEGRVVADDTPDALGRRLGPRRVVRCRVDRVPEGLEAELRGRTEVLDVTIDEGAEDAVTVSVHVAEDAAHAADEVASAVRKSGARLRSLEEVRPSMEDLFLGIVGAAADNQ